MNGWIMSITGIVLISVLVDIILPEGQTNKYIKGIVGLMVVYVIISPLPKLLKMDLNLINIFDFSNSGYEIDETFINNINKDKIDELECEMVNLLLSNEIICNNFSIICKDDNINLIESVYMVVPKDNSSKALKLVVDCLGIKEEQVLVYEI